MVVELGYLTRNYFARTRGAITAKRRPEMTVVGERIWASHMDNCMRPADMSGNLLIYSCVRSRRGELEAVCLLLPHQSLTPLTQLPIPTARRELVEFSIGNKVEWSELETDHSPTGTDNAESRTYVTTRGLPSEFCARTSSLVIST
ncbi:hypothetical protein LAZ67_6002684 [Cordylochernes scorpioides]|uniref:Uncharacterized protein n=1 Tax=Cordylochernes scorpioides TaxID=51811 RepID=A0ABY6KMY8_9ARAC|nr:hypothetical protein LAZ67_6002684 [Cordylochernes scorpioides]